MVMPSYFPRAAASHISQSQQFRHTSRGSVFLVLQGKAPRHVCTSTRGLECAFPRWLYLWGVSGCPTSPPRLVLVSTLWGGITLILTVNKGRFKMSK